MEAEGAFITTLALVMFVLSKNFTKTEIYVVLILKKELFGILNICAVS